MKNQLPNVIFITDVIDNFDHYSDNCGFVPIYYYYYYYYWEGEGEEKMETLGFFGCLVEKVIKGRGVSKIEKKTDKSIQTNQN